MSLFLKDTSVCEYKILNVLIKVPLNTIFFGIRLISRVQICSDICYVNVWHLKIFGYSFGKLFCIGMNLDICLYPLFDICPSRSTDEGPLEHDGFDPHCLSTDSR